MTAAVHISRAESDATLLPTLVIRRPRHRTGWAWFEAIAWSLPLALLLMAFLAVLGVTSMAARAGSVLALLVVAPVVALLPSWWRFTEQRVRVDRLDPRLQETIAGTVELLERLDTLRRSARPGPVADHLEDLSRLAQRELGTLVVAGGDPHRPAPETAPFVVPPPGIGPELGRLVASAERLVAAQQRAVLSEAVRVTSEATERTDRFADELEAGRATA